MAEVRLNILGQDNASPALKSVKDAAAGVTGKVNQLNETFTVTEGSLQGWLSTFWIVVNLIKIAVDRLKASGIKDISDSITSLKDDISSVKEKLEELNATWSDIYEETAGKYKGRLEGLIEEINFLTNYIADLQETFKDAEFEVDLSGLKRELNEAIKELEGLLGVSLPKVTQGAADAVEESVGSLKNQLSGLDSLLDKTLSITIAQAIRNTGEVKTALASIPEVTYKDVVVRYQTMASPLRPFTEGMEYIRKKMESLPVESTHTIKYGDLPASTSPEKGGAPARNVHFAPTINITAAGGRDGGALAEEIDRALADRWRYNRSELKRAMNA